ncbi:glucose 1-dehydrogenase [Zhongshania aquimaris]|uniref:Glucose 1-dehydrogenase n=1 Tax=Zhongshania aquimaris TaxID=2857107 RepID=A0ABS6VNK8_9GAMM|nr:glucose 1-dehydrogenase [Zhongshania aquimaris]MBW2939900.1 glucose 1-dehydrogenase [Zhongshania aquimaris]
MSVLGSDLIGKVAIITGGASGIGRAVVKGFASQGAKVVIADIDEEQGEKVLNDMVQMGGEGIFCRTDVSSSSSVSGLVQKTIDTYGRLDFACNNAGVEGVTAAIADALEEDWDRTININLKGVWLCMKYECEQMLKQGAGCIVNISSVMGLVGNSGIAPYVAAKHGVLGLTKSVALDYARSGIRVNAVCPGGIYTPIIERLVDTMPEVVEGLKALTPMGDLGFPEDIANTVIWLCSDKANYITGQSIPVDGGFTIQ